MNAKVTPATPLPRDAPDLLEALEKAKKVIDGLVDQQAMPNCWWQVDYADILAVIARNRKTAPDAPSGMALMAQHSPTIRDVLIDILKDVRYRLGSKHLPKEQALINKALELLESPTPR